jgi:hypothetical protein
MQQWFKALSLEVQRVPDAKPLHHLEHGYNHHDHQDETDQLRHDTEPGGHEDTKKNEDDQERIELLLVMMSAIKIDEHHYMPLAATANR